MKDICFNFLALFLFYHKWFSSFISNICNIIRRIPIHLYSGILFTDYRALESQLVFAASCPQEVTQYILTFLKQFLHSNYSIPKSDISFKLRHSKPPPRCHCSLASFKCETLRTKISSEEIRNLDQEFHQNKICEALNFLVTLFAIKES